MSPYYAVKGESKEPVKTVETRGEVLRKRKKLNDELDKVHLLYTTNSDSNKAYALVVSNGTTQIKLEISREDAQLILGKRMRDLEDELLDLSKV